MNENLTALLPELALLGAAVLGLLTGCWLPRRRQWIVAVLAAVACAAGLTATAVTLATGREQTVFSGAFAVDTATGVGRLAVLTALPLVIGMSVETVRNHPRETEYWVLLLLSGAGTLALTGADDLLMLFAAYLLASLPAYVLAAFAKDARGTEAALKYYLMGALLGTVMLAGTALLYGAGHTTHYRGLATALPLAPYGLVAVGLTGVLAGLLFKAGAVPAHFWVPDVTEGAPVPVAAYVTTLPKIGGLIAGYRLLHQALPGSGVNWPLLLAVVAALTMSLGNLAAFFQTSVTRLLAYSTISQVGYLLMALAVATRSDLAQKGLLFYLLAYAVTNLGAFAVVAGLPRARALTDYRGLAARRPGLAAVLVVCLLGLVGTPPTGVFLGKLEIFSAAVDGGFTWLAVLAVANTVASLFYYLRWLGPLFATAGAAPAAVHAVRGRTAAATACTAAALSLALGIGGSAVLTLAGGPLLP
ncbi:MULTISPECIES: NADH-quinone oxidoreductase subunit N [unclassified Streptomyces]|uniref:NADH-quinone oxidoreductase subunit N n=1 Tax=unclassified Streptomyces TaxID=2593676 RepID=UPI00081B2308|nr:MULTISPECIES: NADH-quinone oxidoreductase subunit N [unclassified Streptomyces]MYQ51812.1 NADH-quinone oxidoreductase subunit N [Streptomyces sp. SID4941]SCD68955.1 NADH-quinone oxidoreductase subunit N [Streptomyces sp. PalvLS-984]SDB89158.1 NADH-quinone oxidoreductase subunit N [Streptomyces sp. AmelKG-A3]